MQRQPAQQGAWAKDRDGTLYFDTEKQAQARLKQVAAQGEWEELRVQSFDLKGATKWRVEMRGPKKEAGAPKPKNDEKRTKDAPAQKKDTPKDEHEKKDAPKKKDPPKQADPWVPDPQTFDDAKGAAARLEELKKADEWGHYRVGTLTEGDKKRFRVEMRDKLPPGIKTFALTFDDGPHAEVLGKGKNLTENVLDTLAAKGLKGKAGFFVQTGVSHRGASTIGGKLIKRIFDDGSALGIHTGGKKDHEKHTTAVAKGHLESDLQAANARIKELTGSETKLVRAPFGERNADVNAVYAKLSLTHLYWDIDGDKGGNHSEDELKQLFDTGLANLPRGAHGTFRRRPEQSVSPHLVALYHDVRDGTSQHLGALIDHIKTKVPGATFEKP